MIPCRDERVVAANTAPLLRLADPRCDFPLLYLAYVLIRGAVVDWYPYPFLNPARVGGYGGVALHALGIAALFVVGGWLLFKLGNWRRDRLAARPQQV